MKPHRLLLASLLGLVTLGILHGAAQASTYTVVNTHDTGSGSLRDAIEAANANPGLDVIGFAIGGGGAQVIQLLTALPVVTDPVVIDGTTQLGFSGAPLIEIDGTVAGGTGLRIVTGSSTILALGFNQFPDAGISLEVGSDNRVSNVRASWFGPDPSGIGVHIGFSSGSIVEQITATGRGAGIFLVGSNITLRNNVLAGNRYGIDTYGNTGQANRYLDNDLSDCTVALRIHQDRLFEVAGNNFDGSASGLVLLDMTGLDFAPAPGTVDLRRTTAMALTLGNVVDSRVAGLDLSWLGGGQSGTGLHADGCARLRVENLVAHERTIGVNVSRSPGSMLTGIASTASGPDFVGLGAGLSDCAGSTAQQIVASGRGAGVFLYGSTTTLRNNVLAGNRYGIDTYGNTGQANRYLDNDLSDCTVALRIHQDRLFEVAGNNFDGSASGLVLLDMTGLDFAPAPGTVDLRRTTAMALTLGNVVDSRVAGLDLSWLGGGQSGTGLHADGCARLRVENLVAHERTIGVNVSRSPGSMLTGIASTASGPDFVGLGAGLSESADSTVQLLTATGRHAGLVLSGMDQGIQVSCSLLRNNNYGISDQTTGRGNQAHENDIFGNLIAGVQNLNVGASLNAENNYWGASDGPRPSGSGDLVQGLVDVSPFLSQPALCGSGNTPPTVGPITAPQEPVRVGREIVVAAGFTDPDLLDVHLADWDWGDGTSSPGVVSEGGGSGTVEGTHTYAVPGVYTVTVTVTDLSEATAGSEFRYVVVFDPEGGFVTGGGWIHSPAGAYTVDPSLIGKANFGFVAKYQTGANLPTGHTEFQFKAGDLNFKSSSYDWLVVAGSKAKFKGRGTINGSGDFIFQLTATDGQANGGGGSDKFRIRIWHPTGGGVIYDNQPGNPDDADATTSLGGGGIVIHKP